MTLSSEIRQRGRHVVGPLLAICVAGYFAYHVVEGDRGLRALAAFQRELADAKSELAAVEARRVVLDRRVRLLHPETLDPDMLEERARAMLNFGYPEDVVIVVDP